MRSEEEVCKAIDRYADTVKRICMVHLKNYDDTEDVFQTVFIKYALKSPVFKSIEHEKAWIIRVTVNACKDLLKCFFRSRTDSLDEFIEKPQDEKEDYSYVFKAVLSLPQKYRDVIYLHYYEGYTAPEISKILRKNVNSVYTLINRGKHMLKESLGGDGYEAD